MPPISLSKSYKKTPPHKKMVYPKKAARTETSSNRKKATKVGGKKATEQIATA